MSGASSFMMPRRRLYSPASNSCARCSKVCVAAPTLHERQLTSSLSNEEGVQDLRG
jgi:hypothetical protein